MDTFALLCGVAGAIPAAIVGFTGHVLFDLINTDHLWLSWALSTGALRFVFKDSSQQLTAGSFSARYGAIQCRKRQ